MYYEKFRKLCEEKHVKPADVSKATGISTATLSSWKKGKYTPKQDKLQKIADYFGVTMGYFSSEEDSTGYYYDPETAALAQEIYDNKDLGFLMSASRKMSPEDLRALKTMAEALIRKERNWDDT